MFHLFTKKDFESKGGKKEKEKEAKNRKKKKEKEGRKKKTEEIGDRKIEEQRGQRERLGEDKTNSTNRNSQITIYIYIDRYMNY